MAVNRKNLGRVDLLGQLPAKNTKIVVAVALVSIMFVMWAKVFLGAKAEKANAAQIASQPDNQLQNTEQQTSIKVSYIQMPVVPGRNDVLVKDIFTAQNWTAFGWQNDQNSQNVEIASQHDDGRQMHEKNLRQIAETVPVDAVSTDQNGRIQAFIQDNVVSIGSKLTVEHNGYAYEFVVVEIESEKVVLGWKNCSVTLQMSQLQ